MAIPALTTKSLLQDQNLALAIMSNSSDGSITPRSGGYYITAKGTTISKQYGVWRDSKGRSYYTSWGRATSSQGGPTISRINGGYTSNTGATILASANQTSLTSSLGGRLCNNFASNGLNSNKKPML